MSPPLAAHQSGARGGRAGGFGAGGRGARIPLILSNWVAAFAAVHRMWETGDKKSPIYSSKHPPPLSLLLDSSALLFSRACYCLNDMCFFSSSKRPAQLAFRFPLKFQGIPSTVITEIYWKTDLKPTQVMRHFKSHVASLTVLSFLHCDSIPLHCSEL